MKSLPYLRLPAVKRGVAWIICLVMLSPVLANAEDQSEQKNKKDKETSQKNNNENRSDSKKNQSDQSENQSKQNNNNQTRSSTRPDNSSSTSRDQRPSAASPERDHGNSRSMGEVIRESSAISKPSSQRPAAASPERDHGNSRSMGEVIRESSAISRPSSQRPAAASPEPQHVNPRSTGNTNRDNSNISAPPIQRPSRGSEQGYTDPHSTGNIGRDNRMWNYSSPRSIESVNQPPQGSNPRWAGNVMRDVRDAFPPPIPSGPTPIDPHRPIDQTDDDDNDHDNDHDNNYCYNCSGYYQGPGYGNYEPYYEVYRPRIKIVKTNVEEIVTPAPTVSRVAKRTALSSNPRTYSFNIRGFLERQVQRVRELLVGRWPGAKQLSQVAIETAEYCDNRAGVVTLTYYDQDNSGQLSVGDRFDFRFEHCQDRKIGITADGRMRLLVTELAGDVVNEIAPYSFAGRFDFSGLNVVNDQTAARSLVQGNMDFSLSARPKLSRQNPVLDR